MAWYHHITDGMSAERRYRSGQLDAFLPKRYSDEELDTKRSAPMELQPTLNEVKWLVSKKDFETASSIIEASFNKRIQIWPGRYEFEELANVLYGHSGNLERLGSHREGPASDFAEWYRNHPENPYAASLYANALHQLGFSHRGEEWAGEVTEEGWEKLDRYTQQADDVLRGCANRHGQHWIYKDINFGLSISTGPSLAELYERFELACEQQPLSMSLWLQFANMLLPRWFGDFEKLNRLCLMSVERTHSELGMLIYARILAMLFDMGEDPTDVIFQPELLVMAADDMAKRNDDRLRTLGAALYAIIGDNLSAQETISKISTFYNDWWIHENEPYLIVGVAVRQRERAAKKAA